MNNGSMFQRRITPNTETYKTITNDDYYIYRRRITPSTELYKSILNEEDNYNYIYRRRARINTKLLIPTEFPSIDHSDLIIRRRSHPTSILTQIDIHLYYYYDRRIDDCVFRLNGNFRNAIDQPIQEPYYGWNPGDPLPNPGPNGYCTYYKWPPLKLTGTSSVYKSGLAFLENVKHLDLTNFDTRYFYDISEMCLSCTSLESVNMVTWDFTKIMENPDGITDAFENCPNMIPYASIVRREEDAIKLNSVCTVPNAFIGQDTYYNIELVNGKIVVTMTNAYRNAINDKTSLGGWVYGDPMFGLANTYDNTRVTSLEGLFQSINTDKLDLSKIDMKYIENMDYMFKGSTLDTVVRIDQLSDMENIKSTKGMFEDGAVRTLYITNFDFTDTSINVEDMFKNAAIPSIMVYTNEQKEAIINRNTGIDLDRCTIYVLADQESHLYNYPVFMRRYLYTNRYKRGE